MELQGNSGWVVVNRWGDDKIYVFIIDRNIQRGRPKRTLSVECYNEGRLWKTL